MADRVLSHKVSREFYRLRDHLDRRSDASQAIA